MSEPIRYAFRMYEDDDAIYLGPKEQADGQFVLYADYARLNAQVEWLTKAGDLICRMAGDNQVIKSYWKHAKKGVQS